MHVSAGFLHELVVDDDQPLCSSPSPLKILPVFQAETNLLLMLKGCRRFVDNLTMPAKESDTSGPTLLQEMSSFFKTSFFLAE